MSVIADRCPDCRVTVADINEKRIAEWQSEELPVFEPGLADVVKRTRNRNLFFTTDIAKAIREAEIIFISVNTPTKTFGAGAGRASDLQFLEKTARSIVRYATGNRIVVEKSTLPVRAAETLRRIFAANSGHYHFEVISNPEFLAEGTAIADLNDPDRVLIGAMETAEGRVARDAVAEIYRHWIPQERIKYTNLWSSELSKLAANAMLAQRISSVNALSALCAVTSADVTEVTAAIGMDSRIGSKFLKASVGFGGSCFKKDILNLSYLCEYFGLPEAAAYWNMVVEMNEYQMRSFVARAVRAMFGTLADKKIALFGFAFKEDTGDPRESPAITIAKLLLEEHANLVITDPKALVNAPAALEEAGIHAGYTLEADPAKAANGAHAILLVTPWKEFAALDYAAIYETMEKPAFLFDGRNILNHQELYQMGFNVYPLGKAAMSHLD